MRLIGLVVFCGASLLTHAGLAWSGELVTAEEVLASHTALPMLAVDETPVNPQGPTIAVVDAEALAQPVRNPFSIEIWMQAQRDAELNFASFKAFYGAFKVDITERLLKEASKTVTGLKLSNLHIPSGRHRILLRVSDTKGRTAEKEIAFKVE
jgi:hypothetical protein